MSSHHHGGGGGGATGETAAALGAFENRAKTLLTRLSQLAAHLRQILANPHNAHPDWATIVTHFRITETQLEQLHRDVQPFLQYFVLKPAGAVPPPPQADVPLLLSSRSHVEMEGEETQVQAAFWDRAHPPEDLEGLIKTVNEAVERMGVICDWRLAEFREGMKAYKSPGMEVPVWRKGAEKKVEQAFAWLEARTDGRPPPPTTLRR